MIEAGLIPNVTAEPTEDGDDKKTGGSVIARKRKVKKEKAKEGEDASENQA